MVITSRVRTVFFAPTTSVDQTLIRLPSSVVGQYETKCAHSGKIVRFGERPPHRASIWSSDEHERFLHGLELFPHGPWKEVAAIVRTKTTRQTMTHAQKYRQKIERRLHKPAPRRSTKRADATTSRMTRQDKCLLAERQPLTSKCEENTITPYQVSGNVIVLTRANEYVLNTYANEVQSPMVVSDDIVDSIHFERDFQALIASLEPLHSLFQD